MFALHFFTLIPILDATLWILTCSVDDWLIELVELATETGLAVQETKDACGKT